MTELPSWFEAILRRRLPELPPDQSLDAEQQLTVYGLDSLGWAGLVADLEVRVRIPDELLMPGSFRTAATLLDVVRQAEST